MSTTHELTAARAAVETTGVKLSAATQAATRARAAVQDAQAAVNALTAEHDDWVRRASHRIATAAREGRDAPSLSVSDKDAARRQSVEGTFVASQAALAELEVEEREARAVFTKAQEQERQARADLRQAEYDRIANERRALWAQDEALAALLFVVELDIDNHRNVAPLTQEASNVLHSPDPRTSAQSLGGGHVLANLDTPICGELDKLARAREYWHEFDARLDESAEQDIQAVEYAA
jgi:hypothetical protein